MVDLADVEAAYRVLRPVVKQTPLERSKTFSEMTDADLYLKLENLQTTGSFKLRGAYNKIYHLSNAAKRRGVICASAGNHAQGVAHAAALLDVASTVYMPLYAPPTKIIATRSYGATVILEGESYDDAHAAAVQHAKRDDLTFVPAFNDPDVIAGQGTIGLEMHRDLEDIDVVLVPVGGGGLISGVALALKQLQPDVTVIGVEAEGAQAMLRSLQRGELTPLTSMSTIADGIAVKHPGELTFKLVQRYVDSMVTVTDEELARTLYLLLQRAKLVVEPAGAAGLAAVLSGTVSYPGKNVVTVISGGNINLLLLTQAIERGMMQHELLARFAVTVPDKPHMLSRMLDALAALNVNVQSISHDRTTTSVPIGHVKIIVTFQTLGGEQIQEVEQALQDHDLPYERLL
ncbi:MAG: threonine ammonia-lyase [Candidatus Thermoplasmatota archaeon]|nr:threonine ammonia-lyase [Candidatus Thermoplasmatota archaeon]